MSAGWASSWFRRLRGGSAALAVVVALMTPEIASVQGLRIHIPGRETDPPSCRTEPKPPGGELTLVKTVTVQHRANVTTIELLTAGKTLWLSRADLSSDPLKLAVSAKFPDDADFSFVCTVEIPARPAGALVLWPASSGDTIYRLVASADAGVRSTNVPVQIYGDSSEISTHSDLNLVKTELFGYLCRADDLSDRAFRRRSARGFHGAVRLDLNLKDQSIALTEPQRHGLTKIALEAVSIWIVGCDTCRTDSMAVLEIAGAIYVRARVREWLLSYGKPRVEARTVATLSSELVAALEPVQYLSTVTPRDPDETRRKELTDYVKLERADIWGSFCMLNASASRYPVLDRVRNALCYPDKLDQSARAKVMISFRHGHTACGDGDDVVACRADDELTEYNARDFRFSFGRDSESDFIGDGAVTINLLHAVLHEMGHWIGLPHIESAQGIMAAGLDKSRCIDEQTSRALKSLDSPRRMRGPEAFRLRSELQEAN